MHHNFSKNFLNKNPLKPTSTTKSIEGEAVHRLPTKSIEGKAEEFLQFPQEKGRKRTDKYLNIAEGQEQNSVQYGDAARHYLVADETSRSIQDKFGIFKNSGLSKLTGFIGANVGGIIHEVKNLKDGRPFMESVEDVANNLAGSLASVFSRNTSEKILDFYKKIAPDGKVKN